MKNTTSGPRLSPRWTGRRIRFARHVLVPQTHDLHGTKTSKPSPKRDVDDLQFLMRRRYEQTWESIRALYLAVDPSVRYWRHTICCVTGSAGSPNPAPCFLQFHQTLPSTPQQAFALALFCSFGHIKNLWALPGDGWSGPLPPLTLYLPREVDRKLPGRTC